MGVGSGLMILHGDGLSRYLAAMKNGHRLHSHVTWKILKDWDMAQNGYGNTKSICTYK